MASLLGMNHVPAALAALRAQSTRCSRAVCSALLPHLRPAIHGVKQLGWGGTCSVYPRPTLARVPDSALTSPSCGEITVLGFL